MEEVDREAAKVPEQITKEVKRANISISPMLLDAICTHQLALLLMPYYLLPSPACQCFGRYIVGLFERSQGNNDNLVENRNHKRHLPLSTYYLYL